MTSKRIALVVAACAPIAFMSACGEKGIGYGDPNSLIAVMSLDEWDGVADDVYDAFEQTITTVRDEKKFTVTYQEPYAEHWMNLRRFRQMMVIGSEADPWVQEIIDEAREPIESTGVHQVYDVWAKGQTVNLVLLPEGWGPEDAYPHVAAVSEMLDEQYVGYARNRMYMSGVDSALADTLSLEAGFHLYFPVVYRWKEEGGVYVFRNDNPDPSELIREIVVTWESPAPADISADELLEWRAQLVADHYSEPQDMVLDGLLESRSVVDGNSVLQLQAQWRNPPERGWPAGGPFITRAITCDSQDRTYLVDAWLYAPAKEKYEYMIQIETILSSFACGSS